MSRNLLIAFLINPYSFKPLLYLEYISSCVLSDSHIFLLSSHALIKHWCIQKSISLSDLFLILFLKAYISYQIKIKAEKSFCIHVFLHSQNVPYNLSHSKPFVMFSECSKNMSPGPAVVAQAAEVLLYDEGETIWEGSRFALQGYHSLLACLWSWLAVGWGRILAWK